MSDPFAVLDHNATAKKSYFFGLLPTLGTLVTLLLISATLYYLPILWGSFSIYAALNVSKATYIIASVVSFSIFNFWFDRELQYFSLGVSPINPKEEFIGHLVLDKLVNHLVQELNAHDQTPEGHPNHLKVPRLGKFSSSDFKLICVPGRNINRSALYFSDGFLNQGITRLNQPEVAALIMAELHRIKRRRSIPDTILEIAEGLTKILDSLMESPNPILKTLGFLLGPLKICFVLHNAMSRTYAYEAATVVTECGRGRDYLAALNRKGHAARTKKRGSSNKPLPPSMVEQHLLISRPRYEHPCLDWAQNRLLFPNFLGRLIDFCLKPIADWIDANELKTDEKHKTTRLGSFFDVVVRKTIFFVKEINSSKPSGTHLKGYIEKCLSEESGLVKLPYRIGEMHRYPPIDHAKQVKWRFERALIAERRHPFSYAELKDMSHDNRNLSHANEVRKACKKDISRYLKRVPEHAAKEKEDFKETVLGPILEPLLFSHQVANPQVIVNNEESLSRLRRALRIPPEEATPAELERLYETHPVRSPEYRA